MLLKCIGIWTFGDEDKESVIQSLMPYREIKFQQYLRFTQHDLSSIKENYLSFDYGVKCIICYNFLTFDCH